VRRIALNEYVQVLYAACLPETGVKDPGRQAQAYEELGRYLYDRARYLRAGWRDEDLQDATQKALLHIYEGLTADAVREQGAFLEYAFNKLRGALTDIDRKNRKGGQELLSLEALTTASLEAEADGEWEPSVQADPESLPEAVTELQQLKEAIVAELRRKFERHPRAAEQLQAAILKYAFQRDHAEIAQSLKGTSLEGMATLISRGKEKLQNNQPLQALYIQWFSLHMRGSLR